MNYYIKKERIIMGLIRAALNAAAGTLADQYKEFFYCDSIPPDVLAVKGHKRSGKRSTNRGDDNIISSGSVIAVADGQCMMIVEQGKVVELCAETGHFVYDASTEPSIFSGGLGQGIKDIFKTMGTRIAFGGQAPKDQRVYYFNTKEITGNKYGTPSPVPFRVVDPRAGIDIDISIRCFGEYSYHISNPMLFYANVCGNVTEEYKRDQIDGQLKSELLTALQPAFAQISDMGIRYSALPGHTTEFANVLNNALSAKWRDLRGIEIVSVGVSSVKPSEEDEAMIKEMQKTAAYRDPNLAAATLVNAQSDAMRAAANNSNGAAMGFYGMNMAGAAGGFNPQNLYQMGGAQQNAQNYNQNAQPAQNNNINQAGNPDSWKCPKCGANNTGKFCMNCGEKKPIPVNIDAENWTCPKCGANNTGKFCMECGTKRPERLTACPKCGHPIADPERPPKFCPECGNAF